MIDQIDRGLVEINLGKARDVERRLRDLGEDDPEVVGHLGADLSDLYAGAVRYHRLVDALLNTPADDREQLGEILADLAVEMGHLRYHLRESVELVEDLAGDFD